MSPLPREVRRQLQSHWFEKRGGSRDNLTAHVLPHKDQIERYLEVGTFAGASLFWVFENLQPRWATAIDPYPADRKRGAEETNAIGDNVERIWTEHFSHVSGELCRQPSVDVLPGLLHSGAVFDLAYIDGSHHGCDVYFDAALASRLVRPGGFLIFDDFQAARRRNIAGLRLAVDAFVRVHADDYELLFANKQVGLRRRNLNLYRSGRPPAVAPSILLPGEYDGKAVRPAR